MYKDYSTTLNIILWISVLLDVAFFVSWVKKGFFETPTILLLLLAIITLIWGHYVYKDKLKMNLENEKFSKKDFKNEDGKN